MNSYWEKCLPFSKKSLALISSSSLLRVLQLISSSSLLRLLQPLQFKDLRELLVKIRGRAFPHTQLISLSGPLSFKAIRSLKDSVLADEEELGYGSPL